MENNNNTTKSKPVLEFTEITELIVGGKSYGVVLVDKFSNKEYFRIRVEFPNGSFVEQFFSNKRLEQSMRELVKKAREA